MVEACTDPSLNGNRAEAFAFTYSTADEIFCRDTSTGCPCDITHAATNGTTRTAAGYITSPAPLITQTQDCTDHLFDAYEDFEVPMESFENVVEYLDNFGQIERNHKCSGICDYQAVYYFSDTLEGHPEKSCR